MTDTNNTQKMGAPHLTDAEFQGVLDSATTPVVVDFYAEWCGPCKLAAPVIDKLSDEYTGKVKIAKLDVDANPQVTQMYGVSSIPTVIIFKKDGDKMKEVERKVGFPGESGYRQMVAKLAE